VTSFLKLLLNYLLAFIPIFALALLHIFYTNKLAASNKLFVLVTILLIPLLGFFSMEVAFIVAKSIVITAVLTMLLVWTVHAIIPNINHTGDKSKPKPTAQPPSLTERYLNALNTLIVVLPVVLLFYLFQWAGGILIMIFIAILSMQSSFNLKKGLALIVGNLVGGIVAIAIYEMLVVVPMFLFLILLVLIAGLYFGIKVYSGTKAAPLFGMAFSTTLLILGQSTSGTDDAGDKVWIRVVQIMIAVIYVVVAFYVLNYFKQRYLARKKSENSSVY